MARLWEDTLVIALRDRQWQAVGADLKARDTVMRAYPSTFLKLDGRAEETLADLIIEEGERLFLMEVKSTAEFFKDEWDRRQKQPKWPYHKLASTLEDFYDEALVLDERVAALRFILMSLRCHLFAYWMEGSDSAGHLAPEIMVESYVSGCARIASAKHAPGMMDFAGRTKMGLHLGKDCFEIAHSIPFSEIGSDRAFATFVKESSEPGVLSAHSLGLNYAEFVAYLRFLCEDFDDGEEAIHAIVLTSSGRLVRVLTTVSELSALVAGTPAPPVLERRHTRRAQYAPTEIFNTLLELAATAEVPTRKPRRSRLR